MGPIQPNSRDGLACDPWHMVTDELEEAIAKKKKAKKEKKE
jgi:hypothetical protein